MTERILLRIFLVSLISCASMVLVVIWFGESVKNPLYFQVAATFFVVGLASFLVWFSIVLRALHKGVENEDLIHIPEIA